MSELKSRVPTPAVQAVAEAWASIDGKLNAYRAGKPGDEDGYRDGYDIEAEELIKRLEARGYMLIEIGDHK